MKETDLDYLRESLKLAELLTAEFALDADSAPLDSEHIGECLPPFDPTLEREAESSDRLSQKIAAGEIEITRKDVSIDEVIAKIDAYTQENP